MTIHSGDRHDARIGAWTLDGLHFDLNPVWPVKVNRAVLLTLSHVFKAGLRCVGGQKFKHLEYLAASHMRGSFPRQASHEIHPTG